MAKLLTSEQQAQLRDLIVQCEASPNIDSILRDELRYWVIELKPKRIRKRNLVRDSHTAEG